MKKRPRRWPWFLLVLIIVVAVAIWRGWIVLPWLTLPFGNSAGGPGMEAGMEMEMGEPIQPTVPIQRAESILTDLQLSGKLALESVVEVKAPFAEAIATVQIEVGDSVQAGDVLATLDSTTLAATMENTWMALGVARQALDELMQPASDSERMTAEAALLNAQEALTRLEEGPSDAEIAAASLAIQKAQIDLQKLQSRNDPNSMEVRQARFALTQAERAVQDAQVAYDAVSWRGATDSAGQAAALSSATIALESAQIEYEKATAPPTDIELQSAQIAISQAQSAYDKLYSDSTPAAIAQANATVAKAEEDLQKLEQGPSDSEIQKAENAVLEALNKFEEARNDLASGSTIVAPVDGLVTQVKVARGQVVERGATIATLASLNSFRVNLSVTEEYILRIQTDAEVKITADILPDQVISGTVVYVADIDTSSFALGATGSIDASSGSGAGPATYPVIVAVNNDGSMENLRAGMSVQVTFVGSNDLPPDAWLVPASSIVPSEESPERGTIQVMRGETPTDLEVGVTQIMQGEWQVVTSAELQDGDMVIGFVATFLEFNNGPGF